MGRDGLPHVWELPGEDLPCIVDKTPRGCCFLYGLGTLGLDLTDDEALLVTVTMRSAAAGEVGRNFPLEGRARLGLGEDNPELFMLGAETVLLQLPDDTMVNILATLLHSSSLSFELRTLGGLDDATSHSLIGDKCGTTLDLSRLRVTRGGRGIVTRCTVKSDSSEPELIISLLLVLLLWPFFFSLLLATVLLTVRNSVRWAPGIVGKVGTVEGRLLICNPLGGGFCLWCTIKCRPPKR